VNSLFLRTNYAISFPKNAFLPAKTSFRNCVRKPVRTFKFTLCWFHVVLGCDKVRKMKVRRKILHHLKKFPRLFLLRLARELTVLLPSLFLLILILNISAPQTSVDRLKTQLLQNPDSPQLHDDFGEILLALNQLELARREFSRAGSTQKIQEVTLLQQKPSILQNDILKWQKIASTRPDYRDAYLKLALLHWQLYRPFDTKKFLQISRRLDPNNEDLAQIAATLN